MIRRLFVLSALALLSAPIAALAQAPGPYYARGNFYCSSQLSGVSVSDSCFGYGAILELFDDGAHDDGAAGDSVYGAWVTCNQGPGMMWFKVANSDWSFAIPHSLAAPLVNGRLFLEAPDDEVHFRLDMSAPGYGWVPAVSVSNDHAYPLGATLELMGSAPELGSWTSGLVAEHVGTIWQKVVTIAEPGTYEYKFRVLGSWNFANFGYDYNNNFGANGTFTTTDPDVEMIVQFDELTGRIRAIPYQLVPARTTSWGRLKTLHR